MHLLNIGKFKYVLVISLSLLSICLNADIASSKLDEKQKKTSNKTKSIILPWERNSCCRDVGAGLISDQRLRIRHIHLCTLLV